MTWTTPADLKGQVQRLWDRGLMLASLASGEALFPRRLILKGPSSLDLANRFEDVRMWISELRRGAHYRTVMHDLQHRVIGNNAVPHEIWVDSLDDALALIGKRREAQCFAELVMLTKERQPDLMSWLARKPFHVLEAVENWPLLLEIVSWMQAHPRPGIYLRQVDISGVHTKFIEAHQAILSELFDILLSDDVIDTRAVGAGQFCRRYGFRDKPLRIRFRILDPDLTLFPGGENQDIALDHHAFACLTVNINRIFITENEINFLAFPNFPGSMVIFGAGYGFEGLTDALWLHRCEMCYWGDIDTHGFAILDQLRSYFPNVRSFLMDRQTLMVHRLQWGEEPRPDRKDLKRLTTDESALFDDLRDNRIGKNIRLEQERIGFRWLERCLKDLT